MTIANAGSLNRHFFVLGAYRHKINTYWELEPSVLLKAVSPSPVQIDIGLKALYNNKLWFGTGYRNNGDIAALLGYEILERFVVGYSYDLPTSTISNYSSGSHEFMLGIKFPRNN